MIQADSKAVSGAANNIIGLDVSPIDPKEFFCLLNQSPANNQFFLLRMMKSVGFFNPKLLMISDASILLSPTFVNYLFN